MEEIIVLSYLNDFIFCPISIYFHKLYGNLNQGVYTSTPQLQGKHSHKAIDTKLYSCKKNILQGIDVYSDEFKIQGKIDVFNVDTATLTERKHKITYVYDGYIFQLYAQYYGLIELGYEVKKIRLYSSVDNKIYNIELPINDKTMDTKFRNLIDKIHKFDIENFTQTNIKKCQNCIYEPACDRSLIC